VAFGVLILITAWAVVVRGTPKGFHVQDPSFHFSFCTVTWGTNRAVFSGNPLLGRVNRTLIGKRIHRISRDQMYTVPGNQPALTIGYRHDNDALKLNTNGYSYPSTIQLLDASLVPPGGQPCRLAEFLGGGYMPTTKEYVSTWALPEGMTNLTDCKLLLRRIVDGTYVATCGL
jgi:hypothetical protein